MKKLLLTIVIYLICGQAYHIIEAQTVIDAIKAEAIRDMQIGSYGEAIDLLNKYVAARPQEPDGYNFRGLCYEQRKQYELSVYDFRSASKLAPENGNIKENLARTTKAWYSLLYNDIEGYKRGIAINPKNPDNYLQIGKAFKNLGEWSTAELWYDKYLTMAHASSDEIIRYSEILAKNNHIEKGWPVLKKYTEEYPNDQRLWSRFGYFSLWLGKKKIAIEAFENSLALKPYFKEAMDGLDQAKGRGYIYTVNDTSYKHFNYGLPRPRPVFVYPIDRYYRIIKKNPSDSVARIKLVKELIAAQRFEEADQQLQILQNLNSDSAEVAFLSSQADSLSQAFYRKKIQESKIILERDSSDKDEVIALGKYYTKLQDYDSATAVYDNFLVKNPSDMDVLYLCANAEASNRNFFKAQDKMKVLLKLEPNNLKYQLFAAQLYTWEGQNLDEAKVYFQNVLLKEPGNLSALVGLSSLSMQQNNFTASENYMEKIKSINPESAELKNLQDALIMNKFRYKQAQNFKLLQEAETLYAGQKCEEALPKYEEYLKNTGTDILIEKEYADVNACAGHYKKAVEIYTRLLNQGYDFNTDYSRATVYMAMRDTESALSSFQRLSKDNPDNFNVNLYLGDSYIGMHEYSQAREVYDGMQRRMELDSTQKAMIEQRYSWLPVTGFRRFLSTFPAYTMLTPYGSFYMDNFGVSNNIQGLRLDLGITTFLTLGVEGFRTGMFSDAMQMINNTLKWDITFRLAENFLFGINFGNTYYENNVKSPVADIYFRSEMPDIYSVYGSYSRMDASQIIYSASLIGTRLETEMFRFGGYYQTNSGIKISTDNSYISLADRNRGINFSFRLGKYFYPGFILGYEYFGSSWKTTSLLYYSPTKAAADNIFADWDIVKDSATTLSIGGLIGFVEGTNSIIRQGYASLSWRVADRFTIQGRISGGGSFQNYIGYNSLIISLAAYWAL